MSWREIQKEEKRYTLTGFVICAFVFIIWYIQKNVTIGRMGDM